jgi:hypothetical protein
MSNVSRICRQIEQLQEINLRLRQQLEQAELLLPIVDQLIGQLAVIELLPSTAILGRILLDEPVTGPVDSDGSRLLQAAILVPGGVGVVIWDREHYLSFRNQEQPGYQDALPRFEPFESQPSGIKSLLLPEVLSLLEQLSSRLPRETL